MHFSPGVDRRRTRYHMKTNSRPVACAALLITGYLPGKGKAEKQVYSFDVCGASNSYGPDWMPNGDPRADTRCGRRKIPARRICM